MKKVIKINLAAVLALFMAFGLMSFELTTTKKMQNQWYPVNANGSIDFSSPISSPDVITNCVTDLLAEVCAVELHPGDEMLYDKETDVPSNRVRASYLETVFIP